MSEQRYKMTHSLHAALLSRRAQRHRSRQSKTQLRKARRQGVREAEDAHRQPRHLVRIPHQLVKGFHRVEIALAEGSGR